MHMYIDSNTRGFNSILDLIFFFTAFALVTHDPLEATGLELQDVLEASISDSLVLHDVVEDGISDSLVLHDVVEAGISDSVWVSSSAFCRNTAFHTLATADLPIFIFSFVPLMISSKLGSTILRAHTAGTVHPAYLPSCHSTIIMSSFSVTADIEALGYCLLGSVTTNC